MTLATDILDVLKKYGVNTHVLGMSADTKILTIEVPVYDKDGNVIAQGNEILTTYIELPLDATKKVLW